jgi:hypothetical protein
MADLASVKLVGDWDKMRKAMATAQARAPQIVRQVFRRKTAQAAGVLHREILEVFDKQGDPKWPARNANVTRQWHSPGAATLVDRGDLRNSIGPREVQPGIWFVGVSRFAKVKRGDKFTIYNVAVTHEFGRWIRPVKAKVLFVPLTRQMEDAKRRVGLGVRVSKIGSRKPKSGVDYTIIPRAVYIPPRPFIRPGIDRATPVVQKIMGEGMVEFLGVLTKG